MKITRRRFLEGAAAGLALASLQAPSLRLLEAAARPSKPTQRRQRSEQTYRTGHSNNCDGSCGHLVHVRDGRVRLIQGAAWEPTTIAGQPVPDYPPRICLRGICQIQNTYSPDRIRHPYKRIGPRGSGRWQRISWDEATTTIAARFQEIQAKYGKKSVWIAPYTGSLGVLEGVIGAGYRFASVIGASGGDFEGDNEGDSATPAGFNYVLVDPTNPANGGGFLDGHEYTDFLNAKTIFLWANNLAETSIPDWRTIMKARQNGTRLVVLDPRYTPTAASADLWVPIRPGTDAALVDGMIRHILHSGLLDAQYVRAYTVAPFLVRSDTRRFLRQGDVDGTNSQAYMVMDNDGRLKAVTDPSLKEPLLYGTTEVATRHGRVVVRTALEALRAEVEPYTPEYVASLTDVDPAVVIQLGDLYGRSRPAAIKCGFGLSHWYRGDLTYQALLTMAALTGNIGVHGGGVTTYSGALLTSAFNFNDWLFPDGKSYTYLPPMAASDAMLSGDPYPVRAAWFVVDNFAQQMSDKNKVRKALESLDFLVVSDYVMSATADLADIVLPSCTYLEKTDLLAGGNYYLQYMPKVIEPLWESKSDLDQFTMVATKMGYGKYFDKTPDEYIQLILRVGRKDADPTVHGLTMDQLKKGAPHLNTATVPYVPFYNKQFPTKSGRIEFYVEMLIPYDQELCGYKEPIEASKTNPLAKKYPLIFLSTHTRFRTHSQYTHLPWLEEINNGGEAFLEINPKDARERGIRDGAVVRVFNDRGYMKVRARYTEGIKPGVVNCYQGGWDTVRVKQYIEGHPNNLTHQIANPAQSVIPNFRSNAAYYDCLCEVEPVEV
jgi:anaerobic selenocysteine-containing dehydrogenase